VTKLRIEHADAWIRLFDQMPISMIATDGKGLVTSWNASAQNLFGWSAAETVGRPLIEIVVPRGRRDQLEGIIQTVAHGNVWEGPCVALRRDGSQVLLHSVGAPLMGADGTLKGVLCISVEIGSAARVRRFAQSSTPISASSAPTESHNVVVLSAREKEIVELIVDGRSPREIADALGIRYATVRNHTATIYRKVGVHSRAELLRQLSDSPDH
jgi:PAS domain S-box-containing protein